jgi:hypothetical protein
MYFMQVFGDQESLKKNPAGNWLFIAIFVRSIA